MLWVHSLNLALFGKESVGAGATKLEHLIKIAVFRRFFDRRGDSVGPIPIKLKLGVEEVHSRTSNGG